MISLLEYKTKFLNNSLPTEGFFIFYFVFNNFLRGHFFFARQPQVAKRLVLLHKFEILFVSVSVSVSLSAPMLFE